MVDRTCDKCGKVFAKPFQLKRHLGRKTPCDPILDSSPGGLQCRFCGRAYGSAASLSRHTRTRCKIANSEEGMDKLMEHTLQRQLREQSSKIDELTALVKQMTAGAPGAPGALVATAPTSPPVAAGAAPAIAVEGQNLIGLMQQAQQITNVHQVVNIAPWDGDRRIAVGIAQIAAAFAENSRLKEYARLGDHELVDPEIAPPYVTELLVDLTKRAHADLSARNVYLNPKRADQALVHMTSGKWEVLPLADATRLMFDGVAQGMQTVSRSLVSAEARRQLPLEAQNALAMAGLLYDDEPDEYVKRAKGPMAAHLVNTAPASLGPAPSGALAPGAFAPGAQHS